MRNAGFHQGKNEHQWKKKEVNRNTCIQHFLIKCVTRIEFVKVSRTKKRAALAIFFPNQTYCCCCFFLTVLVVFTVTLDYTISYFV